MKHNFGKVTAIVTAKTGNVTAYFNDMPGLLVQGSSMDDIKIKLKSLLKFYIDKLQSVDNFEIQTKELA